MEIEVLKASSDSDRWDRVLSSFPGALHDIYSTAQYHSLCEANGEGQATAFVAREGSDLLFHPFLLRPITRVGDEAAPDGLFDIETAYGYGGPLATTMEPGFISQAWQAFARWCGNQTVIAEFIRFNPFLENNRYMGQSCQPKIDRETVVICLDRSEDDLWADYPSRQRSNVRKAWNTGLTGGEATFSQGIDRFRSLYIRTMDYIGADSYYYFSDQYFEQLSTSMGSQVMLFEVKDKDRIIAAGLFLIHDGRIHFHLGASDHNHRESRPNNLLFHTVASWGREQGFSWLHLGGGSKPSVDDPLFRFKASMSKNRLSFYAGGRIFDNCTYKKLCAQWMRQAGLDQRPDYFLLYRMKMVSNVLETGDTQ